jgi:hypothetical protein
LYIVAVSQETKETPAVPSASELRYCTKADIINTHIDFRLNVHTSMSEHDGAVEDIIFHENPISGGQAVKYVPKKRTERF